MTEPKHTAGDCDKKGPHAGHDLSVELQKAAELRFLVLFANELISNLSDKDIELDTHSTDD